MSKQILLTKDHFLSKISTAERMSVESRPADPPSVGGAMLETGSPCSTTFRLIGVSSKKIAGF